MRRRSSFSGAALALIAAPALAHVGDHGEHGAAHFLAQHGLAAAVIATVIAVAGAVFLMKRKG